MPQIFNKIKKESKVLNMEIRQRTIGFVVGGFSFVAGLAWNDAVKSLIEYLIPLGKDSVLAKFIYAILISIIVVAFSIYLTRLFSQEEKK